MDEDLPQDSRFAQLFAPIKDLTKNWDIDLATLLQVYMHDLDSLQINIMPPSQSQHSPTSAVGSKSQGKSSLLNFAEAAFLVQGSAQIYSRKVEYLYELTLNLLDFLASRKPAAPTANGFEDGDDPPPDQAPRTRGRKARNQTADDEDECFASLDSIQESADIDLIEEDESTPVKRKKRHTRSQKFIKAVPLDLVPLEEFEKSDVPLTTRTGEVVGKKDDFRINTCYTHASGALLLNVANSRLVDLPDDPNATLVAIPSLHFDDDASSSQPATPTVAGAEIAAVGAATPSNPPDHFDDSPRDDDDDTTMHVDTADEADGVVEAPADLVADGDSVNEVERHDALRGRRERENLADSAEVIAAKQRAAVENAFAFLEPFEKDYHTNNNKDKKKRLVDKPAQKGRRKTYRFPECLSTKENNKDKSKKRKRGQKNDDKAGDLTLKSTQQTVSQFLESVTGISKRNKFPKNPLKVVAYGELDDLFYVEMKRRSKRHALRNSLARKSVANEETFPIQKDNEERQRPTPIDYNDTQLDRDLLAIFEGPDLPDEESTDGEADNGAPLETPGPNVDNGADLVGDGVNRQAAPLNDKDFDGGFGDLVDNDAMLPNFAAGEPLASGKTYEQLVREQVEQFMSNAHQSINLTDLAQRVHDWERKIAPALAVEETRRLFDVNIYGDEILRFLMRKMGQNGQEALVVPFADFVDEKERFEICRYALASLMLANHENIEIVQSGSTEESVNTMTMKYLTSKRHYKQVEQYVAPSRVGNEENEDSRV